MRRLFILEIEMMEKDYSLLRPFDLEAAKRGEPICAKAGQPLEFIAEAGRDGKHAIRLGDWNSLSGCLATWNIQRLRMAPTNWLEGKPVYKAEL